MTMARTKIQDPTFWNTQVQAAWEQVARPMSMEWTSLGFDWRQAEPAVRLGYGAAAHWAALDMWTAELEARLEREWLWAGTKKAWAQVRAIVRHGWQEGRRRIREAHALPQSA